MNKSDILFWRDSLDRFGLLIGGIFLGGLIENIGIKNLSIIISVALLLNVGIIDLILKRKLTKKVTEEK